MEAWRRGLLEAWRLGCLKAYGKRNDALVGFYLEDCSGGEAGEIHFISSIVRFLFGGIPFSYVKIRMRL